MRHATLFSASALGVAFFLTDSVYAQEHEHHPPRQTNPAPAHGQDQEHSAQHAPASQPADAAMDPHAHHHPPAEGQAAADEHAHHAKGSTEAGESEREHVPPDPPTHELHDMPAEAMIEMMGMDDTARYGKVLFDQLDWRDANDGNVIDWDAQAWYGSDYHKLWFKTEGERVHNSTEEARAELLWDRIFSRWWSVQTGVRHDFGEGPSRNWLAVGVEGLAPYFFEIEATAYFGEGGRTAARFSAEYDLLLTQRLILQPELEFNLYGKDDPQNGIGSGLSDVELGLRLRYEIRREIAPYVGVAWTRHFGNTADLIRRAGDDTRDIQVLAGIRFWF